MPVENHPHINAERKLAAIMFTDISGYTKMMGLDEEKGLELVRKNREIHKPLIKKYKGKWIKEMGDGVLAQFDSAYNASRCAIEIQQRAKKELNGKLRIGLHIGEIIVENEDIFGDGVNVASRIESLAEPGGIFFSESFYKAIQSRTDIHYKYLGEFTLKNVSEPVKIYCVVEKDLTIPTKERIKELHKGKTPEKITFRNFFKRPIFYILIIFLLISLFVIQNLNVIKNERTVKAIAVLPFSNLTGNIGEQYFVDGLHDAVITEISKIGDLIVKSRTSTLQFRETLLSVPEIAKILNVDALIEATVYKTGDSVFLNFQLIKTRPVEDHIWADDYKRDTRHILSLYGELAKTVANEVEISLSTSEEIILTNKSEVDPDAYRAYMHGQYHWNSLSPIGMDSAEYYFLLSKKIDPNYALAYAGLASVGLVRAQFGIIPFHEAALDNRQFLEKAMEMDSSQSQVQFLLAGFDSWGLWNFNKAEKEFLKSIELNQSNALAHVYYAQLLCILKRYDEARLHIDTANLLDPFNPLIKIVSAQNFNFMKRADLAIAILEEIRKTDPYNGFMLSTLRTSCHITGEYKKAIEIWMDSYILDSLAHKVLSDGFEQNGYHFALEKLGEFTIKKSESQFITPWRISTIYTRAGNADKAIDWLEKAYLAHDQNMPSINTDPIFDFLRDDPRFQIIVNKMNFPVKK